MCTTVCVCVQISPHLKAVYERATRWQSLRISYVCEVVPMALEVSLCAVAFYDSFYEANCESSRCSVEKMCYIQFAKTLKRLKITFSSQLPFFLLVPNQ